MFGRHNQLGLPVDIDWSDRAIPLVKAVAEGYKGRAVFRRCRILARENVTFLLRELETNEGVIVGYHGTTAANADHIGKVGFENRMNEEGLVGVSAWDQIVGYLAIEFAAIRSHEADTADYGRIIKVRMRNPEYDHKHARLEWLADARQTEVLEIFTPEQMYQELGLVDGQDARIQ